ncbi:MAG: hypothetical protein ACREHV_03710 [Rhizomicrobium sp.]
MSLLETLHGKNVDAGELSQLLLGHFRCSTETSDRTQLYGLEDGPSLTVRYGRKGGVVAIDAGPNLFDADVAEIESKIRHSLLNRGPEKIGRQVLFANIPTDGWFRFGDVFQIVPVPPEAPRPRFPVGQHPFLLEVRFVTGSDMQITGALPMCFAALPN